jgi:hypothetical protein
MYILRYIWDGAMDILVMVQKYIVKEGMAAQLSWWFIRMLYHLVSTQKTSDIESYGSGVWYLFRVVRNCLWNFAWHQLLSVISHSTGTNYAILHKLTIPVFPILDEISHTILHLLSLYKFYIEFAPQQTTR